jgi:hypothetical protein
LQGFKVAGFQGFGLEGEMARTYRDLLVWQKVKTLAVEIYKTTQDFPTCEKYGLANQLRRAGVSVASNSSSGNRGH